MVGGGSRGHRCKRWEGEEEVRQVELPADGKS